MSIRITDNGNEDGIINYVGNAPAGPIPVPVHLFESESAAAYADLISIWYDLHFVEDSCVLLLAELSKPPGERNEIIVRSLWTAVLAVYARCFISGKRKPLPKSDVSRVPLEGEVKEWHQWLIDMRNKHIAHSVNGFEAVQVGVSIDPTTIEVDGVVHLAMNHISTDKEGVEQTRLLAHELIKLVLLEIQNQEELVLQEAKDKGPEVISQYPDVGAIVPGPDEAGKARS